MEGRLTPPPECVGAPALLSPLAQLLIAGVTKIIQLGPHHTPLRHTNLREASLGPGGKVCSRSSSPSRPQASGLPWHFSPLVPRAGPCPHCPQGPVFLGSNLSLSRI